jgi:hypothetical protein
MNGTPPKQERFVKRMLDSVRGGMCDVQPDTCGGDFRRKRCITTGHLNHPLVKGLSQGTCV